MPDLRVAFDFNSQNCDLTVECREISSNNILSNCQIFEARNFTLSDLVLLSNGLTVLKVQPDTTYYFLGMWKSVIKQQIFSVAGNIR